MGVLMRTNDVLDINPPAGDEYLSENGSNWLWAVTAVYAVSLIGVVCLSFFARAGEKIFHYLFIVPLFTGTVAYFAMASDLGWSLVLAANNSPAGETTRQIFFAKYVNWVVAFPSITIATGLLWGVSWATIVYNVFLSWIWIISYLCSAYTTTNYKWGFFGLGTAAEAVFAWSILYDGLKAARRVEVTREYNIFNPLLNIYFGLYPTAFGLSDGGNRIGVTASFIFFGILDILLVPFFTYVFLFRARSWDYNKLDIAFTQYGRVRRGEDLVVKEPTARTALAQPTV
jgi:bacteriorhodopsin